MKKLLTLCLLAGSFAAHAQSGPLGGFEYGPATAPDGKEWEDPQRLALNKEQPRAWFFTFENRRTARQLLPQYSDYYRPLNGTWKFNWAANPEERPADFYQPAFDASGWDDVEVPMQWNVAGIQPDGSLRYGVPIYANQPVIFAHEVAVDDWRGGVMRTPPADWVTYKHRNEVGSYRRAFTIPESWNGRQVYINFDGVSSFFYLWINGQYVGFSKNSRNTASFDITPYLNKNGQENIVAVEVYRNSDGSFLEAQDMFRLPGIFRTVSLTSTAKVQVRDLRVWPDLKRSQTVEVEVEVGEGLQVKETSSKIVEHTHGLLRIEADIRNLGKKAAKGYSLKYTLYANELYSDQNEYVVGVAVEGDVAQLRTGENTTAVIEMQVPNVRTWSAEEPWRYVLVGELRDRKGQVVETFSTGVGFRKVEIRETPAEEDEFGLAGRYYYINGQTVKLKGVNRQEINPAVGNAISAEQMEQEIMLMKRGNINHVRNSHYSCDPYWYYLCDKYGIYLEDEANLESHQYYYGDASLSHVEEFEDAHVARVMELAHAHVNHPSVVIWSLGNEAGPGKNFVAAYDALHAFDPSRPVQYERNNDIVDMGSNQYPSIAWMRGAVTGKYDIKYPFHVSEYAHSMGNAGGNLIDYWEAIESTNFFCGAAIWDWVDQSLYNYDPDTGDRYWAYGGDFGDKPNSGMFCMNGILLPDHSPKPVYYEVKKVYQNVGVKAIDMTRGEIEIFNKNYFTPLTDYRIVWELYKDGEKVIESDLFAPRSIIGPRMRAVYGIPYDYTLFDEQSEYFVKVRFLLASDKPWAQAGYAQMEEQLLVKPAGVKPSMCSLTASMPVPEVSQEGDRTTVRGEGFVITFDDSQGTIHSIQYDGREVIRPGQGPRLDALRAPTDNDNWAYMRWFEKGLHNLRHKAVARARVDNARGNTVQLMYTVVSQAPNAARIEGGTSGRYRIVELTDQPFAEEDFRFVTNQIWTVYPDGSVELRSEITSNDPSLVLARLGYAMQLPKELEQYDYYGRGPWNNYNDRCSGAFIEHFASTVDEQYVRFPKPQSMGNREAVRWCALTDREGNGVAFVADSTMSASALPWSALEMTLAPHPYQLPESSATHLHLDLAVTGLGGNSCGQGGPLEEDRVKASSHAMGFLIRPVRGADLNQAVGAALSGEVPISISRSRNGMVTVSSRKEGAAILCTIDGNTKNAFTYTEPFALREGGTVTARYADQPAVETSASFGRIERIPMTVINASSQETGIGDAANLVDGDPATTWHTMYSVTVAKYPHWVDFDAGEVKRIRGFRYLPRQDGGSNGNIREYTIEVSLDGKTWGEPVAAGEFARGRDEQRIELQQPVEARYVRFTALSAQNGADFAGGAEFSVIAD